MSSLQNSYGKLTRAANFVFLDNVDANVASSAVFQVTEGGPAVFTVVGDDFGGGTVTLEIANAKDTGGRFVALTGGAFTDNGTKKIDFLPAHTNVRVTFLGATTPSNVWAALQLQNAGA